MPARFPFASVVIPAFNNRDGLRNVLKGMLALDYPGEYEVIVVDDGSGDGTPEMLDREFAGNPKIKAIHLPRSGVCKARNAGIRASKGEIVVNMDHDCVPERDWLKRMAEGFAESPRVGVVTGYGGYGGTSTGYRRELLEKVGGYDEDYFYYREDTDLTFKVLELGYTLKQVDAPYRHDHKVEQPKSFLDAFGYGLKRIGWHRNDVLLWKKHPNKRCAEFLHVKFGFLVDPRYDFSVATGTWHAGGGTFGLSSPRGIVFLENKSPLHALIIALMGLLYVVAVKIVRLHGSLTFRRLLL